MKQLNANLLNGGTPLPESITVGPMGAMPERVLQFGEGNFLRAFVDWMINTLNARGMFNGRAVVVQPIQQGMIDVLNEQDGLYTLVLRGLADGKPFESYEVPTAISRAINPYTNWADFLACASNPDLRYIISNTTEAGIAYIAEPFPEGTCPTSYPAKLTALLFERYTVWNGAPDKGLLILPCELSDRNGDNLRRFVLQYCKDWELPDTFCQWLSEHNVFFNTLVDRIVPGYPRDEAAAITEKLGYIDRLLDTGEPFHLWVIEGDAKYSAELPFDKAGLNVVWTDDLEPYRTRKVRILNGAHTTMVPAGYLAGMELTRDCVEDPLIGRFVRRAVFDEIIPTIDLPEEDTKAFAEAVIQRFRNPFIDHPLLTIAYNSTSKYPVRVLPSLLEYHERKGQLPPVLTFSLSALIAFYRGTEIVGGSLKCECCNREYLISDDADSLAFFAQCWKAYNENEDLGGLISCVLARTEFWERDLNAVPGLHEMATANLRDILELGSAEAIRKLMGEGR